MGTGNVVFAPMELIGKAWEVFKNNLGPLFGGYLLFLAIMVACGFIPLLGSVVSTLIFGPLIYGYYKIAQDAVAGRRVEFGDLFCGLSNFLPPFLANLVVSIFTAVGIVLCIIPGVLVAILYLPVYLVLIDGEPDFWKAMERSRKMVMANLGQWILLVLALMLLNLVGLLACGIGMLVTVPVSTVALALAYNQSRGDVAPAGDAATTPAPPPAAG